MRHYQNAKLDTLITVVNLTCSHCRYVRDALLRCVSTNQIDPQVRAGSVVPFVTLFATRDIAAGEEVSFSYANQESNASGEVPLSNTVCHCGSDRCLGYLPALSRTLETATDLPDAGTAGHDPSQDAKCRADEQDRAVSASLTPPPT